MERTLHRCSGMSDFETVLAGYARRYGLSTSQRQLLRAAASGREGAVLADAMGVKPSELDLLAKLFHARTGRSLDQAVDEIAGIVRSRSSRPTAQPLARKRALRAASQLRRGRIRLTPS